MLKRSTHPQPPPKHLRDCHFGKIKIRLIADRFAVATGIHIVYADLYDHVESRYTRGTNGETLATRLAAATGASLEWTRGHLRHMIGLD